MNPTTTTPVSVLFSADDVNDYAIKFHINTVLTVVASLFACYMIIYSSGSKSLGPYKWYLLNIVVTSLLFDIYVTVVVCPFPLIPPLGCVPWGCSNGSGCCVVF